MLKDKEILNNEKLDKVVGGGADFVIADDQVFTNEQIKTLMEKNKDNNECYRILSQMLIQEYIKKEEFDLIAKPLGNWNVDTAYNAYGSLMKKNKFDIRAFSYLYHKRFPGKVVA